MTDPTERDLIAELSRLVLSDVAPQELPLFPSTSAAHFAQPEPSRRTGPKDETLGFGIDVTLLTPAVLAVVTPVVRFLLDAVADSTKEEASASVARFVRRLFRRDKAGADPDAEVPEEAEAGGLSPEQVLRARDLALGRALQLGVPEGTAQLLADSIAGSLVAA